MSSTASEHHKEQHIRLVPIVDYQATEPLARPHRRTQRPQCTTARPAPETIRTGSAVVCRDGTAGYVVGVVTRPPHGCLPHLLVRYGWLRPRTVRVSLECVTQVAPAAVELTLTRHTLARRPSYRHDYLVAEQIERMFHGDQALGRYSDFVALRATVDHGVVKLCGNVRDATRRLEAERAVARVPGVLLVRNFLFWDDDITWQAARQLNALGRRQLADVRIETCLGLVRLDGRIAAPSQRALATAIVEQIPGVHAVGNNLVVDPAMHCGTCG